MAPLNVVMLVLVLYLLPQFSGAGECLHHPLALKVPVARQTRELRSGPVLSIYGDQVLVNGISTASHEEVFDHLATLGHLHPLLYDGAPPRWVVLQADRSTPWATLRPLLERIRAMGLELDLVVEKAGGHWLLEPRRPATHRCPGEPPLRENHPMARG